ncbi:MAG: class I SAM-dependent methyltransferase [Patescibacteria group bacterium]
MELNLKILDLGCGKNKIKGAIGIDRIALEGVDIVRDLSQFPYHFEDRSIDKIYCWHILEHFDVDTRMKVIEEIHRILKPTGLLEIVAPHAFSIGAFHDPTHKSFFTFHTMDYFTKQHPFSHYTVGHFSIIERRVRMHLSYDSKDYTALKNEVKFTLESIFGRILNKLFKLSNTLPDLLVKILPFYVVEIFWLLKKEETVVVKP